MAGLADLVQLANNYTGIMVALLWIAAGIGWKMLQNDIEEADNTEEIASLAEDHQRVESQVNRVDQKQDHIVERQAVVLNRLGASEQEIQELREDTARLDERHERNDDFLRGGSQGSGGD